jgi:hypothetical protein
MILLPIIYYIALMAPITPLHSIYIIGSINLGSLMPFRRRLLLEIIISRCISTCGTALLLQSLARAIYIAAKMWCFIMCIFQPALTRILMWNSVQDTAL